jgi:glutathione S-transferase
MKKLLCRYRGETPDPEEFKRKEALLAEKLEVYEKILSKQRYLAGDVSPRVFPYARDRRSNVTL